MTELKTSDQWKEQLLPTSFVILDPDGWNRKNYHFSFYEELIDIDEFVRRLCKCTIQCHTKDFELVNQLVNEIKEKVDE